MGHSISHETYERVERYRAEDRLCQAGGRCHSRARLVLVHTFEGADTTFVLCKKHTAELVRSFERYGFVFDNDHDSKILGVCRIGDGEDGTAARARALREASAHTEGGNLRERT